VLARVKTNDPGAVILQGQLNVQAAPVGVVHDVTVGERLFGLPALAVSGTRADTVRFPDQQAVGILPGALAERNERRPPLAPLRKKRVR